MKLLPRRRDGLETRARLLRVARETFEERGYHRTSVAEICRRASVANGTFYRYFNSKEKVFLLLAETLGEELEEAVAQSLRRADTLQEKVLNSQLAFYEYVKNNRALYQIFREAEFIELSLPVQTYHRLAKQLELHLFADAPASDPARSAVPFAILGGAYMLATKYIIWDEGELPLAVVRAISDLGEARRDRHPRRAAAPRSRHSFNDTTSTVRPPLWARIVSSTALAVSSDVKHGIWYSTAARRMRKPLLFGSRPFVGVLMSKSTWPPLISSTMSGWPAPILWTTVTGSPRSCKKAAVPSVANT